MDEHEENFKDIFRYTDVEYTPDGYTDVYRWDDFLVIAGDHVYSAMDTIDSVSPGGKYEGFDPQYAYTCEIVGCGDLFDGCALFRPVSHDGEDYIQIAFLRSDIDDSTGEYTERFEAGSFDMPAADALRFDLAVRYSHSVSADCGIHAAPCRPVVRFPTLSNIHEVSPQTGRQSARGGRTAASGIVAVTF